MLAIASTWRTSLALSFALTLTSAFAASGCGSGHPDLTPDAVRSIPAGTGTGSAASGTYTFRRVTTACSGRCSGSVSGFPFSVCDVGDSTDDSATVTQTDGVLVIDISDTPSLYRGGIDADGSYDVGAYATEFGGDVEITARSEGVFEAGGFVGTARSRTRGVVEMQSIDCIGSYDVSSLAL